MIAHEIGKALGERAEPAQDAMKGRHLEPERLAFEELFLLQAVLEMGNSELVRGALQLLD